MKRIAVLFAACSASAAAAFACSSSSSPETVGTDAGTMDGSSGDDDAASGDAGSDAVVSTTCGAAPWVSIGVELIAITVDDPDGSAAPGVEFTSSLCPGYVEYSDNAGHIEGQISANMPFYARLQASGFLPELAPEEVYDASSSGNTLDLYPTLLGALIPGYSTSSSTILLAVDVLESDAGACSSSDGVTITVPGHPEAVVTYYATDSLPTALDGGTATTTRGLASIAGLAPNQLVSLAATKSGCTVTFARAPLTGRTPLETGFVSLMPAYLSP